MKNFHLNGLRLLHGSLLVFLSVTIVFGQQKIQLDNLSFFKDPGPSWKIASDVQADLAKKDVLTLKQGTGVLVNLPDKKNVGKDLFTHTQYGDIDLEIDYLMATGSNSGIYLQGRYEVQLLDSWASHSQPRSGDNGGIYERWDEARPEGKKGYEGYAPRQNVSRSPGLWQHLKISFRAPRFDAMGTKVENAKMLLIELNGVVIHEDVELFGPTRGGVGNESAVGPIRLQGDHGAVAFRNIVITNFDKPRPAFSSLTYKIFQGRFTRDSQLENQAPVREGQSDLITSDIALLDNNYTLQFKGPFIVSERGEYKFNMVTPGGIGQLSIDNQPVIQPTEGSGSGKISLTPGQHQISIFYSKFVDWIQAEMTLRLSGPGVREYVVNDKNIITTRPVDPILVHATENTLLRSFMDIPDYGRIVHAVSVGSPQQVHFTYDMDNGTVVQFWRGEFLDATPMWHDRGDGSSRPEGSVIHLGKPMPSITKLSNATTPWVSDTTGTSFQTKGYRLDNDNRPVFRYKIHGATIEDAISVVNQGQGFSRTITVESGSGNLYVRLAEGIRIDQVSETLYVIDDKTYYIQLTGKDLKPIIRESGGKKEMILPIQQKLQYSILF